MRFNFDNILGNVPKTSRKRQGNCGEIETHNRLFHQESNSAAFANRYSSRSGESNSRPKRLRFAVFIP